MIKLGDNNFSDKCSEIILEQKWNKLSTIQFILYKSKYFEKMSRIVFSYLSKIKVQKPSFTASVNNKEVPPKAMEDLFYFHNYC